ncbi:ATP-binding protein [Cupriavidus sp. DL-D2]|uniref:sensor histidine kinase n=1 Tax=Cupriavidus sp. DL-D2 TaxID=3144974 RepID=UPI0032143A5D
MKLMQDGKNMTNELDYHRCTFLTPSVWPMDADLHETAADRQAGWSAMMQHAPDVQTLRHISQTLAAEVSPGQRVETLLRAALQSTGATFGCVAAIRDGSWESAASATASNGRARFADPHTPSAVLKGDRLPVSILATAIRLRNGLVLDDACSAASWRDDEYVQRYRPRSVICVPMRCNGMLVGALYLEHRHLFGMFTSARSAVVEIIALQAGFALENARLHDALSEQVALLTHAEEKMRNTLSELARASRFQVYGEMIASIVHEVVQPVTALDSSARAGLRWLDRSAPDIERARQTLAHISACATRARAIIDGLRAKARQDTPNVAIFDADKAVMEVADMVTSTLEAMKIDFRVEGQLSSTSVQGERVLLQQALINLLMNGAEAMQAVPEGERQLVLSCEAAPDQLRLHIDDRGEGFDPELAGRLFEPLFTTKPEGMGMGLAISRSIVEAHHGELVLTHRPQGGTRATITLPRFAS